MHALTLWRPWTDAIVAAPAEVAKRVENRDWSPPLALHGQRFALHAGKRYDEASAVLVGIATRGSGWSVPSADESPQGVVGVVRLRGIVRVDPVTHSGQVIDRRVVPSRHTVLSRPELDALVDDQYLVGPYGWLLDDVVQIPAVACGGAQKLWRLPESVERMVVARAAEARAA